MFSSSAPKHCHGWVMPNDPGLPRFTVRSAASITCDQAKHSVNLTGIYNLKSLRSFAVLLSSHQPQAFSGSMSSISSLTISLLGIYPYYKLAALIFSVMLFRQLKKGRDGNPNGLPLPPGPKGYPLIGNLFDMPVHKPWLVYDQWRRTYGKTFIIINGLSPQILVTGHFR